MTCTCGKNLHERTVATKTREIGEHVIVLESKSALCCDEHGVVAWGTLPKYQPHPFGVVPYVNPYVNPYVRPVPYVQPYAIPVYPQRLPSITYGGGSASGIYGGRVTNQLGSGI